MNDLVAPPPASTAGMVKKLCLLLAALAALACTPPFDWRSQKASTHGDTYRLEYPGKPLAAQRTVVLADQSVTLTLSGVQTQEAQFALGHVPAANALQAQALAKALASSFIAKMRQQANLAPAAGELELKSVKIANTLGAFEYQTAQGGKIAMARFAWTAHAAYELLAVGSAAHLPPEVAEQFVRSIQFEP